LFAKPLGTTEISLVAGRTFMAELNEAKLNTFIGKMLGDLEVGVAEDGAIRI
jgi:hypothetical protein